MATATRSAYGSRSGSSVRGGGSADSGSSEKSSTTHYAYLLLRDSEGNLLKDENGRTQREFVNDVQIFENEGQYGTYLKMRVTGPVPTGDIFIQKKRAKTDA